MSTAKQVDPAAAAELFIIQDQIHEPMHDHFLWTTMQRRHAEAAANPEWEELREIASKIKEHTLTHLDHYLEEFEANAKKRGAHVHWALDATDHNQTVYSILQDHGVKELIKSKSMLQEECQVTPFLQQRGIKVIESDLGERIQQLDGQPPIHIVFPAIHKTRQDVAHLFARTGHVFAHPEEYHVVEKVAEPAMSYAPHFLLYNRTLNPWVRDRELPQPARKSFREWYLENRSEHGNVKQQS